MSVELRIEGVTALPRDAVVGLGDERNRRIEAIALAEWPAVMAAAAPNETASPKRG